MTFFEMLILFGAGYLSGFSVASGFILQGIKRLYASVWTHRHETTWALASAFNALLCSLMAVVLIGVVVIADQPDRTDFWPRAALFALGLGVGGAFVFTAVHLVNLGVRLHIAAQRA